MAHVHRLRRTRATPRRGVIKTRHWLLATAAGATLVAAATGFTVARSGESSSPRVALDRQASAGIAQLHYPSDWHRAPAGNRAPGLTSQVVLTSQSPTEAKLTFGVGTSDDPTLLPAALVATLGETPPARIVQLGDLQFYRYRNVLTLDTHQREDVYALRTTQGSVIAICTGGALGTGVTSTCETILKTLRVGPAAVALAPGPDVEYARALDGVIGDLNLDRTKAASQLHSRNPRVQAQALGALANAHLTAAARLGEIDARDVARVNDELIDAMQMTGDAYRGLAGDARRDDVRGYRRGQAALNRSMASLASAFAALRRLGYRVG